MSRPTIGSLFSGYGGLDIALHTLWPNAKTAWVSDVDKGPQKVLAHRYPDAPNLGDITKVDWSQVEPVDIITGGSPCQDLSHAGKRAGMKTGTRSGLWASMCDAIDILRPSLVVWENVRGALSAEATIGDVESCGFCVDDDNDQPMRALGRVLGDLADIGYDAAWVGLRAADVGAPHGRFRVFVLAWPADAAGIGREWLGSSRLGRAGLADGDRGTLNLPTPRATRGGSSTETAAMLPTPRATDGTKGGPNQRGSNGDLMLPSAVAQLLPTPAVNDMGKAYTPEEWDAWTAAQKAKHGNGNGHGKSLEIEAARLMPTPSVADTQGGRQARSGERSDEYLLNGLARHDLFGQYAPAIARWEAVIGRPASAPTEPTGKGGANRLSPRFTEWMMGLPDGWITDVPGVTRNEALKLCGNGVVPQQAAEAVRWLLNVRKVALNA
jgi:DNA (cytosine-5)-methyltransferase 1